MTCRRCNCVMVKVAEHEDEGGTFVIFACPECGATEVQGCNR